MELKDVRYEDTLAEWLRRWPAKSMGFSRESSNLSGVDIFCYFFIFPPNINKEFERVCLIESSVISMQYIHLKNIIMY